MTTLTDARPGDGSVDPRPSPASRPEPRKEVALRGDLLLALGVIGLGVFFAAGAFAIRVVPTYAHIGPRFFPFLVAAGHLACGAGLLLEALRGHRAEPDDAEDIDPSAPVDWKPVALIGAALLVYVILLRQAGFVASSAVLFTGVAAAFGSRRHGRDLLIGLALAATAYVVFTRFLGLHLPAGLLPG